jgi:hypothetical protein
MTKLSEKKEEELWEIFDEYTRGWNYNKMDNYFKFENQTFNDFLFYLEENTSWFDWKSVNLIHETISEYIQLQGFLRHNKTNI